MGYDSRVDTCKHLDRVYAFIRQVQHELENRGLLHDRSKLESPEVEMFDKYTPLLKSLTYGSVEYEQALEDLGPALQHHYKNNRHHPEHNENGIDGMTLIDIIEMLCDWKAASERHDTGDILKSLEINKERFDMSPQLFNILYNTVKELGWIGED